MLTAIPFFFLPKTLPKEGLEDNAETITNVKEEKQREGNKKRDRITKGKYKHFKFYIIYYLLSIVVSVFSVTLQCTGLHEDNLSA